jgi:transcriptional regulator with GAF, ATPase, and Fis domain
MFSEISCLLRELAQLQSVEKLFRTTVDRIAAYPSVSLARIWLTKPGDICPNCLIMAECNDQLACLHLVASAGKSTVDTNSDWTSLDGAHKRFPMGARKVGHIASTGKSVIVRCIDEDSMWIAHPDWARKEMIKGFAGQPLTFRGEVLGVLAIFTQTNLTDTILDGLRVVADHVAIAIANASAFEAIRQLKKKLEAENTYLRQELFEAGSVGGIVGKSIPLQKVLKQVELVAPTNASVLILGESGSGKDQIAREIHRRSLRKDKPMIKVNCASIPKDLFESEFFGHSKGAFTGALTVREGRFNAADGGTLFLDEIGEIPLELQSKLLRVLQDGEYARVGENTTRKVDTRIVAATNRDLKQQVKIGRFRDDLYFRLNVFPIEVPPLRARKDDIGLLAEYFFKRSLQNMNRPEIKLTMEQLQQLHDYDWPGNCRELQNIMERAAIISISGKLRLELPQNASQDINPEAESGNILQGESTVLPELEMIRFQKENTLKALRLCNWKIYGSDGAAELLGIKPTTLTTRIKKMGLKNFKAASQFNVSQKGRG